MLINRSLRCFSVLMSGQVKHPQMKNEYSELKHRAHVKTSYPQRQGQGLPAKFKNMFSAVCYKRVPLTVKGM